MAKRKTAGIYHGFLNINKPAGMTSHDVVSRVRRATVERRVGHAGTLDPAATGVLPIAVGDATKVIEYLANAGKTYIAEMYLGRETDTGDRDGRLISRQDVSVDPGNVEGVLQSFVGTSMQTPPMHSAVQVDGKRLYELARQGLTIDVDAREITISELSLLAMDLPRIRFRVACSKGTYIRSLVRDIAHRLGTVALLSDLQRTVSGPFHIDESLDLTDLPGSFSPEEWRQLAFHPDIALQSLPAVVLGDDDSKRWRNGRTLEIVLPDGRISVYDAYGVWLGIGFSDLETIHPEKVVV